MTAAGYVVSGYTVVGVTLATYAAWVVRRGRQLSRRLPAGDRRWM